MGRMPPTEVTRLLEPGPARVAWVNEVGGVTWAVGDRFVKWSPPSAGTDLTVEAERLRWASSWVSVPAVLSSGTTDDGGSWLVTAALPGRSAVDPRWLAEPAAAVTAIGRGLRMLHDTLPVDDCPWSWRPEDRLAAAPAAEPDHWHAEHRALGADAALARLADPPPVDRLVVCHADACAPNTVVDDSGAFSGHVDLGHLGVADRWSDLAVATWSTTWNYGPGWEDALLDAYGVAPDPERTAFYRLLWDCAD
jgi:kanamycin kinase